MSPNIDDKVKKFINENNNEVEFNQHTNNWLNELLSYLKYLQLNNLGDIPVDDLVKRLEFNLNNKEGK